MARLVHGPLEPGEAVCLQVSVASMAGHGMVAIPRQAKRRSTSGGGRPNNMAPPLSIPSFLIALALAVLARAASRPDDASPSPTASASLWGGCVACGWVREKNPPLALHRRPSRRAAVALTAPVARPPRAHQPAGQPAQRPWRLAGNG